MKRCVGIIGGMGPLATVDLMAKIIDMTQAADDSDHLHVIVDSNTHIPSRANAILHGGENPLPQLVLSARRLETAGADLLIIACNTAHYYNEGIAASVSIPVLNMLEETARHCRRQGYGKVGLLAVDMVLETGLYHRALARENIAFVLPSPNSQADIMRLVFEGVKQNRFDLDIANLKTELDAMHASGVDTFILGCTELPIAFERYGLSLPIVDPTRILAAAAIREAGCELVKNTMP